MADQGSVPWLLVVGYGIGTLLAIVAARRARGRERLFWIMAAAALVLLGVNKQLDLQTALTAWARQVARDGGWYGGRRQVQKTFIFGGGAAALGIGAWLIWLVRGLRAPVWAALAGLGLLGVFVMLRAASFHHVDGVLGARLLGARLHVWIELAGVAATIAAAGWACARPVPNR